MISELEKNEISQKLLEAKNYALEKGVSLEIINKKLPALKEKLLKSRGIDPSEYESSTEKKDEITSNMSPNEKLIYRNYSAKLFLAGKKPGWTQEEIQKEYETRLHKLWALEEISPEKANAFVAKIKEQDLKKIEE